MERRHRSARGLVSSVNLPDAVAVPLLQCSALICAEVIKLVTPASYSGVTPSLAASARRAFSLNAETRLTLRFRLANGGGGI
jgi:hypothetical protein